MSSHVLPSVGSLFKDSQLIKKFTVLNPVSVFLTETYKTETSITPRSTTPTDNNDSAYSSQEASPAAVTEDIVESSVELAIGGKEALRLENEKESESELMDTSGNYKI